MPRLVCIACGHDAAYHFLNPYGVTDIEASLIKKNKMQILCEYWIEAEDKMCTCSCLFTMSVSDFFEMSDKKKMKIQAF